MLHFKCSQESKMAVQLSLSKEQAKLLEPLLAKLAETDDKATQCGESSSSVSGHPNLKYTP